MCVSETIFKSFFKRKDRTCYGRYDVSTVSWHKDIKDQGADAKSRG